MLKRSHCSTILLDRSIAKELTSMFQPVINRSVLKGLKANVAALFPSSNPVSGRGLPTSQLFYPRSCNTGPTLFVPNESGDSLPFQELRRKNVD